MPTPTCPSNDGVAGLGITWPDRGLVQLRVTESAYKAARLDGQGRHTICLTLEVMDGNAIGQKLFDYQDPPTDPNATTGSGKPALPIQTRWMRRTLVSMGVNREAVMAWGVSVAWTAEEIAAIMSQAAGFYAWFEPAPEGAKGSRFQLTYIVPEEIEDVRSGKIKFKEQKARPQLGGGASGPNASMAGMAAIQAAQAAAAAIVAAPAPVQPVMAVQPAVVAPVTAQPVAMATAVAPAATTGMPANLTSLFNQMNAPQ